MSSKEFGFKKDVDETGATDGSFLDEMVFFKRLDDILSNLTWILIDANGLQLLKNAKKWNSGFDVICGTQKNQIPLQKAIFFRSCPIPIYLCPPGSSEALF